MWGLKMTTKIIQKTVDFNDVPITNLSLIEFAVSVREFPNNVQDFLQFKFDMVMYWGVYNFLERIENIIEFQGMVFRMVVNGETFAAMESQINRYLILQYNE